MSGQGFRCWYKSFVAIFYVRSDKVRVLNSWKTLWKGDRVSVSPIYFPSLCLLHVLYVLCGPGRPLATSMCVFVFVPGG